ncbi:AMP-binding protein [Aldersonia kunmingensis]|uniref:AMP-binding protein n=1 Tax=Aldersonia kunmingensis TaxID=408066 RepID=UPI001C9E7404|nr:AMP-binding protein [Aldersonia kunmingensis]
MSSTIAIVGTGFGGLAAAIELKRAGFDDITLFERADAVGGVWRDNTYPGAECDVPSAIYSFSYALKPDWSALFGKQDEIRRYLDSVADEFGITKHIRFRTEITSAEFDDDDGRWTLGVAGGPPEIFDIVIMATGQLSRPKMPTVTGLETFAGESFHSALWQHDVDIAGKKVVVVGSGASAVQVVPAIADQVADLTVVQRSPNWVMWKSRRRPGRLQTALMRRSQRLRTLHHNILFLAYESRYPLVLRLANPVRLLSQWWLIRTIKKNLSIPDEVEAAIPRYKLMCNRLLLSNDWYPTLGRDDVHLVGSAVTEVDADGVITSDGRHIDADVIIWCTGFKASEFLVPISITGRGGVDLHRAWSSGATAYLGMTVPDFPNFFMLFGPNTNSITNTIVFLLERQAAYIRQALEHREDTGLQWLSVSHATNSAFQKWLDEKMHQTVFTDGCPGWYTNENGKVTAMWPASHLAYARATARFAPAEFDRQPIEAAVETPIGAESPAEEESAQPMPDAQNAAADTICSVFDQTVRKHGEQRALSTPDGSESYTYAEYQKAVRDVAAALYGLGVRRGDTVLLMFENRPDFHIVDLAAVHLGAATCSVYNTAPARDIKHIIGNCAPKVAVCESKFLPTLTEATAGRIPLVSTGVAGEGHLALADLDRPESFDFESTWKAVDATDVLTLIYTSGTTGTPKGVELTHRSMLAEVYLAAELLEMRAGDRVPSAMPMAHAAQRWGTHYNGIAFALDVVCIADVQQLVPGLQTIQPHIWGTVPRVLEKIVAALSAKFAAEPDEQKQQAISWALEIGQKVVLARRESAELPSELAEAYPKAKPVLDGILAALGLTNLRWLMVGAAPTPPHVLLFMEALGLDIVEVWGMTELGAVATINPIGEQRAGSVGKPLRGVEIAIAEDGEVLVRGPILMRGYHGDPQRTAETIDGDGWLHTGDIGELADGYLRIVDRKKELIVTASGKNISPQRVEATIKGESSLVGSVVAIGDSRPFITALIVLDPEVAAAKAAILGVEAVDLRGVAEHPDVVAEIDAAIARANAQLARIEQVKRHSVIADIWMPGGTELTPTMKLRRRPIADKYASVIEDLYAPSKAVR